MSNNCKSEGKMGSKKKNVVVRNTDFRDWIF